MQFFNVNAECRGNYLCEGSFRKLKRFRFHSAPWVWTIGHEPVFKKIHPDN
jgi:hypothetical protein